MGTLIDYKPRGYEDCQQRWERTHRAALLDQYRALQAEGISRRQAANALIGFQGRGYNNVVKPDFCVPYPP